MASNVLTSGSERVAVLKRLVQEVFIDARLEVLDELIADDYVDHDAQPGLSGRDSLKEMGKLVFGAFTERKILTDEYLCDDGRIVNQQWSMEARHTGEYLGIKPTNQVVVMKGMETWRVENGQIHERWASIDMFGLLAQLGALPASLTGGVDEAPKNRQLVLDFFAAAMARETHRFNEFVREDYIEHQDIGQGPGFQGLLQRFAWVYEAYPDFHVTEEITLCDGDKVAFFYTDRGTFAGPWQGIPPTGRKWDMQGIHIFRIQDGRIAEHWGVVDTFGLFLKMGILSQTAKQLEAQMGIA